MGPPARAAAPRIIVTVSVATRAAEPDIAARKNALYADGIRRAGGDPQLLDATAPGDARREAFAAMAGLLLTGGAAPHPAPHRPRAGGPDGVGAARGRLQGRGRAGAAARRLAGRGRRRRARAI